MQISDIPTGWLLLDIERIQKNSEEWRISEVALITPFNQYHYKALRDSVINKIFCRLRDAKVVVGHNIRRHDIPALYQGTEKKAIPSLDIRICDTLELSALFLVGKQTHKLSKLYRQELGFSDPLEDAWESFELYQKIEISAKNLPSLVCYWAWQLLPDGYPLRLIPEDIGVNDWSDLEKRFIHADIKALQKYVEDIPKKPNINNLGIIIFLNWLYHIEEPLAHRPKWVEETFPQFREAEAITFPILSQEFFLEVSLEKELKYFFGDNYYFRDNQLELIKVFLSKEVTPLGILPTGGGKSLTFQFPALILSKYQRGLSIIISPLQALMMDQVQNLQEQLKVHNPSYVDRVALLSGTQSLSEQKEVIDNLWQGKIDILYLSPERLRQPTIQRVLKHRLPVLWVLDEAHTLSQWGHDFRPDFMRIAGIIKQIYQDKMHECRWGFVTATATDKVITDLKGKLEKINAEHQGEKLFAGRLEILPRNKEYFQWRKEIKTYVENISDKDRENRCISILVKEHEQHPNGVAIVYVRTRKETHKYLKLINDNQSTNLRADAFHSRIKSAQKQEILQKFKDKQLDVVVATNAFGMGIDREGIHTVIHLAPPATPESYLQEVGRLARKQGEKGKAYLFQDNGDFDRTFNQENKSQISYQALKGCWDVIGNKLKQDNGDTWISTLDLEKHLEIDDSEIIANQTRTVLYHLEAGGLIREKESCSCILYISLNNDIDSISDIRVSKNLVQYLKDTGIRKKDNSIDLDIREVALAISMYPTKVINSIRQLVKTGLISWRYEITFKFTITKISNRIDEFEVRTLAFLDDLLNREVRIEEEHLIIINNVEFLENDISATNKDIKFKLNDALKLLTKLKLAQYERQGRSTINFYFKDQQSFAISHWIKSTRKACDVAIKRIKAMNVILNQIFKENEWSTKDNQIIDIAQIDRLLPNTDLANTNPMHTLNLMQGLGLIALGRGDSNYDRLYHIVRGETRERWSKGIYDPLREHYIQRCQRVYAIKEVLKHEDEENRVAVLRDYFLLTLDKFKDKYFPNVDINQPPIISEIINSLSPSQLEIVKDDTSRALLVLAGPGSGKTRTIVHRVAHLIAVSGVSPSKILVLSHTRIAAAEVRKRLYQLLGSRGSQVDTLTFHSLASKLTGLKPNDAPKEISKDKKFEWLLEQLIIYINENGTNYQYILIDEYQDINELQYRIVKLLGNLRKDENEDDQQDSFLVAVGDPNQNLFEFGGSSNKFISEFRKDWAIQDQPERCLFTNYRSLPAIVNFTNNFINQAIPSNQVNQTGNQIHAHRDDGTGEILWGEYSHPYHASKWISQKIEDVISDPKINVKPNDVLVLAHRWSDLRFVQHFLQELEIPYQFYDNSDDLRPSNSLIGQKILEFLRKDPSLKIENPTTHLESIRLKLGYSNQDVAWKSLLATLHKCINITQEEICYLLEEAKTIRPDEVVLSTFHSAKGSEFSHVFVLEDGKMFGNNSYESRVRELYVGFTRAKNSLLILFNRGISNNHPASVAMNILRNNLNDSGMSKIEIPVNSSLAQVIRYQRILEPEHLYLSHNSIVITSGRNRIDHYGHYWGDITIDGKAFYYEYGSASKSGNVAFLSEKGEQEMRRYRGQKLSARGYTIFRVDKDDRYVPQDYLGDHHYVVLPCLEIEENVNSLL